MPHTQVLLSFGLYFSILLTIGVISHKRLKTAADFIMGNRSLNFWLTALSAHASDMSAWLFMAFPAAIFMGGLSQAWTGLGLCLGMYLNWQFIAKKLRTQTESTESYTLSTFFERRFNDTSGTLRLLTAGMTLIFLTCYLSAGLIAMGYLFETVFGIGYYNGLTIASLVIVIYTFTGGYITVAWTDLFQALFLIVMILIVPIVAYTYLPEGLATIAANASKQDVSLGLFAHNGSFLSILFLVFGWGLGYFGQPHIITKFMGIRDPAELNKSKYLGMTWQVIALLGAAAVGLVGIGLFPEGLQNPELVFVDMVKVLFPTLIAGFILCAILAANMSTMDSQILVCASVLSEDLYKRALQTEPTQKHLVRVSRFFVLLVSAVSLFIAFNKSSTVLEAVLYAWSGLGCAFGPLVIMSLYFKKATKYGAVSGILVGGTVAGLWTSFSYLVTDLPVPAMIPGFALSMASIYIVSLATYREPEAALAP